MGINSILQTITAEDYGRNNAHFLNEFMELEESMDEEYAMILDFIEHYELTVSQREIAAPTLLLNVNIKHEEELSEIVFRYLGVVVDANKRKRLQKDDSPLNNWKYTTAQLAANRCFRDENSDKYISIFQSYIERFAAGHVDFLNQVNIK